MKNPVGFLALLAFLSLMLAACAAPIATPAEPTPTLPGDESPLPFETVAPPSSATPEPALPPAETAPAAIQPAPLDLAPFKNLDYRIPELAQPFPELGGVFQFTDGVFNRPIPNSAASLHIELLDGAFGDLNGDGVQDGVAVLFVETGGSGSFRYLATLINRDGVLVNNATLLLGDRVQVDNVAIDGNAVRLAMLTHAPSDPQCCPTQQENRAYLLVDDSLVPPALAEAALQAANGVQALRDKDMQALASLAYPPQGIRFSPYAYVRPEDLVFTPEQIATLMDDPTVYTWGAFDGSGEPIRMQYPEYHARFVFSRDFASPDLVSFNQRIGIGNSLDNSQEF